MVSDRHDSQPNSLAVSFGDVGTLDNRGGFLGAQVNLGPAGAERPRAGSPAATPHAASDDARGAGSDAEDAGGDAGLSEAEISELATIYSSRSSAGRLLVRAGLPPQRVPEWAGDAAEFWRGLSDLLTFGVLVDGRRRLLRAALDDFPANRVLASAPGIRPTGPEA